ncbi:MAG TPA: protoheme IX farnesyltransferase [Rhodospirillales bacterium]|nr:protoheme IX farnesyltransferase [Rhodospirillales bacterium]
MTETPENETPKSTSPRAVEYALLLKPRVMSLVVFTAWTGLMMAPGTIDPLTAGLAIFFIAIAAGASGAINMWYDRDIDVVMERTRNRPLPAGRLDPLEALGFGSFLAVASVAGIGIFVNVASAGWLMVTILYYVFIYTVWLKRRTPQNIVIGGAAGAFPPMIGWIAVSGGVEPNAIILFLIIFVWTPPHTWALALFRSADYERAGIPMMPVVVGAHKTKIQMLIYTIALVPVTLLPVLVGMSGRIYGVAAVSLGIAFVRHAIIVLKSDDDKDARKMFFFSIFYLFLVFVFLLADKAILAWWPNLFGP